MEANECKAKSYTICKVKFHVGQHVRIGKETLKFSNASEQNFSTEIFRINIIVYRIPRPVCQLEDWNKTPIDGQFYGEEFTPVRISKRTMNHIDKILKQGHRQSFLEYFVRWRGYPSTFDSWVPASSVKTLQEHEQRSEIFLRDTVEYRFTTYMYPDNTNYDFIIELAEIIDLGNNDKWEVGLSE